MKRKEYEKELRKLQARLCLLQDWVKQKGMRIVVAFEGRDAQGARHDVLLEKIPPEQVKRPKVKLPRRSNRGAYDDAASLEGRNFIPERY